MRLKHLNRSGTRPSGNPRYYYRPKGRKGVRLPDLPTDHPAFLAAYAEAAGLTEPPRPERPSGSLGAGIRAFRASDKYLSRAASTRARWCRMLDDIDTRYGHAVFANLRPKHIQADLAERGPHPANNRLKVWRALCKWASEAGLIADDPAASVRRRETPASLGHTQWTREDVATFRTHWPIENAERLAFELMYWTGARISDAVRLSEGMIGADGWLEYTQQKTGGTVAVPIFAETPTFAESPAHLHAALTARPERHLTFMVTAHGKPRSVKAASQWFSAAAKRAGLSEDRTAHGLRKLRAATMAENGATQHQIAAWTGHESLSEVAHYTRKADRRKIISGTKVPTFPNPVPTFDVK